MLGVDLVNTNFRFADQFFFDIRNHHVEDTDGNSTYGCIVETQVFDIIQNFGGFGRATYINAAFYNGADLPFADNKVALQGNPASEIISAVNITQILRDNIVKQETSEGGFNYAAVGLAICFHATSDTYFLLENDLLVLIGHDGFINAGEDSQRSIICISRVVTFQSQVIAAENYVLGRHCYGFTVLWFQEVIG